MIRPKSCNRGFKSAPLVGGGICLIKGFDVNIQNRMKPKLIIPANIKVHATNFLGREELKSANATIQIDKIIIHNSSEPSCAPQTADNLYWRGSKVFEFMETYLTVKSFVAKQYDKRAKDIIIATACA